MLASLLLNESSATIVKKVKQLIKAVIVPSTPANNPAGASFPSSFAKEIVSQGIIDFITYWLNSTEVLHPDIAYKLLEQSRSLSPQQLTRLINK